MDSQECADLGLLQALRLKGRLDEARTRELLGAHAWSRLVALECEGFAQRNGDQLRLTPAGRERLAALVERERAGCDVRAVQRVYEDAFDLLNHDLKAIVTAWQQLPSGAPNDHTDAAHDAGVVARLGALHGEVCEDLAPLFVLAPRLAGYPVRLTRALQEVQGGNARFLAHPLADSYHQVWFELHEELLGLLGRKRVDEAKAGRA